MSSLDDSRSSRGLVGAALVGAGKGAAAVAGGRKQGSPSPCALALLSARRLAVDIVAVVMRTLSGLVMVRGLIDLLVEHGETGSGGGDITPK